MIVLLLAIGAMAFRDAVATFLTVAETNGRGVLAGALAAGNDLASVLVTLAGAGAVIAHGWTVQTAGILAAMMATSFAGTIVWTRAAAKWIGAQPVRVASDNQPPTGPEHGRRRFSARAWKPPES